MDERSTAINDLSPALARAIREKLEPAMKDVVVTDYIVDEQIHDLAGGYVYEELLLSVRVEYTPIEETLLYRREPAGYGYGYVYTYMTYRERVLDNENWMGAPFQGGHHRWVPVTKTEEAGGNPLVASRERPRRSTTIRLDRAGIKTPARPATDREIETFLEWQRKGRCAVAEDLVDPIPF